MDEGIGEGEGEIRKEMDLKLKAEKKVRNDMKRSNTKQKQSAAVAKLQ